VSRAVKVKCNRQFWKTLGPHTFGNDESCDLMVMFTSACARTYDFSHLSRTTIRSSINVVRCVVKKWSVDVSPFIRKVDFLGDMKLFSATWNAVFGDMKLFLATWKSFGDMKCISPTWNHFGSDMSQFLATWNFIGDMKSFSRRHESILGDMKLFRRHEIHFSDMKWFWLRHEFIFGDMKFYCFSMNKRLCIGHYKYSWPSG